MKGPKSGRIGWWGSETEEFCHLEYPSMTEKLHLVYVEWKDLRVTTKAGRELLKGISGVAVPGQVVALMGASGAGKTTLLNSLLHRNITGLEKTGEILVNGHSIGAGITAVSAYVQQEDLFLPSLTVHEHLLLQACLRLPDSCSHEDQRLRVDQVINDMLLDSSKDSRIGTSFRKGISGGEMKRLAFATELLNNPAVLFCDEPTTGLDSHMAMLVVKKLEQLAGKEGKTIICTIHQPASDVFEIFDKVVMLAQGRVAFHGAPYEAVLFFSEIGYMVPNHTNPADHFIETLAIAPGKVTESVKKANFICDEYSRSEYASNVEGIMKTASRQKSLHPHVGPTFWRLFKALLTRYVTDNIRHPSHLRARFQQKIVIGLFLGALYFQTDMNQDGLQNINGALFFYVGELTYSTIYGIQSLMLGDFPLLVREYHSGIYPTLAYYIARVLSLIPIFTFDGIVFLLISYWAIGLTSGALTFLKTLITCVLIEWNVASIGVLICSVSPSYVIAITLTGPMLTFISTLGGLYTNVATISPWVSWIQYVSWFRYGYESLIINEMTNVRYDNISCESSTAQVEHCLTNGLQVIEMFNFDVSNMYFNWGCMLFCSIVSYCIGYIGLVIRVQRAR